MSAEPARQPTASATPAQPAPASRATSLSGQIAPPAIARSQPSPDATSTEAGALKLLQFEAQLREAATVKELGVLAANGSRAFVRARHAFLIELPRNRSPAVLAVSEVPTVDRHVPLIGWIEQLADRYVKSTSGGSAAEFDVTAYSGAAEGEAPDYPMRNALWIPLKDRSKALIGALLFTRETPWREQEITIGKRLAQTIAHAWLALTTTGFHFSFAALDSKKRRIVVIAAFCVACFPVSLTALAPLEIAPRDAFIVTAPIDGVVEELITQPNSTVREGQVLLRFADTVLKNRYAIAEREVQIADARLKKAMQQAFSDVRGRHEVGLAQTELQLKRSERDFARDIYSRVQLKAGRAGLAVIGDPRDIVGRPVVTGEKIMEIADPRRVEIRIDTSVADASLLQTGAAVKVFLDSDPLRPLSGRITRADYQARVREGGLLSVRAVAEFDDPSIEPPRLGIRGTAQIYGNRVPLLFHILRRPLAAARQTLGL